MADTLTLALVGCGWISEEHLAGYADLFERGCREFHVTACCDLIREKAETRATEIAAIQGARPQVFTDPEDLIRAQVAEAADVCVPHCYHHSTCVPLLEGGMHVLLEKPFGITIKAGRLILDAAAKHGRTAATAENTRRHPTARAAEWAINRKRLIGDVLAAHTLVISRSEMDYSDAKFKWRGVKVLTGGGMILDTGAHFTDMMLHLFGDVDTVSCTMATYDGRTIENAPVVGDTRPDVEDAFHAVIRFKSGALLTWTYSRAFHGEGRRFAGYYGTDGTMEDTGFPFKPFDRAGRAILADGRELDLQDIRAEFESGLDDEQKFRFFPYGSTNAFAIEVWDFVNAVARSRVPETDGLAGMRAKTLCECCYESATAGRPVTFEEVARGEVDAYQQPINDFWKI